MPGFVLEEAFPLARFHNTIGVNDSKHFVVGLNALESTLNNETVSDDADLVAITVQGEGYFFTCCRPPIKNVLNLGLFHLALPLLDLPRILTVVGIPRLLTIPMLLLLLVPTSPRPKNAN